MSIQKDFYSKKSALGVPNALVLLMIVFFFVPFAFRGARMALQKTENNVKDWLPSDFRETEELAWFANKFVSEQFIIATWDGCNEEDQRLKLFVSKLESEVEPGPDADPSSEYFKARRIGTEYNLFLADDYHFNWGERNEKWLVDGNGRFYFVTPNGRLYRWDGNSNMLSAAWRGLTRTTGSFVLEGQFIAAFGDPGTDGAPNPFWQDPRLLTAPLFKSVETGPDLVGELARKKGGPLHNSTEPRAGERDAIARLTGTMFGPPVPSDFAWTSEAVEDFLSEEKLDQLPEGWQENWEKFIAAVVEKDYAGVFEDFQKADPVEQSGIWYEFFDRVGVEEPERQTCVVLTLTEAARSNLGKVLARGMLGQSKGRVFQISEECGVSAPPIPTMAPPPFSLLAAKPIVPEPVIRLGGPPVDNVAIDEEGTITLVRLIGYSLFLGLVLSWVLLRSTRLMMMVFFVGGVSAMASLGMVWWSNASVDAILLTMPSLVYVLGMAGAIHIVNYYRDAALEKGTKGAPERAISHAVMPCTLAAVTTAIGLVSLCSSNILPIRKFGIFSAMGVMATLVLLYTYLPSALSIFPPKFSQIKEGGQKAAAGILGFWEAVGAFILRRHWWVNAACLITFIGLGFGLFRIHTSVQLLKLFDSNAQIIKDYGWLEENFGRLVPMELVVRFPKSLQKPLEADENASVEELKQLRTQLTMLERAEAVSRIQEVIQERFGYSGQNIVGRGMSAVTLVKNIPDPWAGFSPQRSGYNRMFQESRGSLLETDYLALEDAPEAEGTELWRVSLRLGALNDVDYGQFVSSLREVVEPVVAAYRLRHETYQQIVQSSDFAGNTREVGRVLVLGYSPKQIAANQETGEATVAVETAEESQLHMFAEAIDKVFVSETTEQPIWHSPELNPLSAEKATSDAWAKYLQSYQCVIILQDHEDYDWDFIRKSNPNVVDARPILAEAVAPLPSDRLPNDQPVALSTVPGDMDVVYTGVVPVVYKAQRTLLVSLIESVAWAFVLIAFVMTCLLSPARSFGSFFHPANFFRGLGSGALSMIPNVFPVVIIFGFIGWSDILIGKRILVDIGTMMTASVAMGVAVDDTIHFLTWFRDGLRRGLDRRDAIFVAYKHVAPAMTQTTIIAGLGLSVFALSTFTPTQMFGTLMLALLCAALVGDLIFLPALLASPLGRIFTMRLKPEEIAAAEDATLSFSGNNASGGSGPDDGGSWDGSGDAPTAHLATDGTTSQSSVTDENSYSPQDSNAASSNAVESADASHAEAPKLQVRRPQLFRDPPTKARRRSS